MYTHIAGNCCDHVTVTLCKGRTPFPVFLKLMQIPVKDKPTHSLSFGQKKRVAIAGIFAMEPEILVLDEPAAGLDPRGVSEIMQLLTELQQQYGLSIIMTTHDMATTISQARSELKNRLRVNNPASGFKGADESF